MPGDRAAQRCLNPLEKAGAGRQLPHQIVVPGNNPSAGFCRMCPGFFRQKKITCKKKTTKNRKGDTSRTSSQGLKLSSGPSNNKKGDRDINENTKNAVKEEKPAKLKVPAGAITK